MSYVRKPLSIALCTAFICVCSNVATASIIAQYNVSSTSVVNSSDANGNDAPHGLWTSQDIFGSSGSGAAYYDIQDDMLFTQYSDGTASLVGHAVNPYGSTAFINLALGGFMSELDDPSDYKKESGRAYDANLHDFYSTILGSITFNDNESFEISRFVRDYKFQMGLGANAKSSTEFGASAWLKAGSIQSNHWDLNLRFSPVPEPTTALIWVGLLGGAFYSNRRRG